MGFCFSWYWCYSLPAYAASFRQDQESTSIKTWRVSLPWKTNPKDTSEILFSDKLSQSPVLSTWRMTLGKVQQWFHDGKWLLMVKGSGCLMSASTHMHYVSPIASGSRTGLSSGGDMDCFPLGLKTRTRQCVQMDSVGSRPHIWAEDTWCVDTELPRERPQQSRESHMDVRAAVFPSSSLPLEDNKCFTACKARSLTCLILSSQPWKGGKTLTSLPFKTEK